MKCLRGCNVPDPDHRGEELRFEPGDDIPDSLPAKTLKALARQGCVDLPEGDE